MHYTFRQSNTKTLTLTLSHPLTHTHTHLKWIVYVYLLLICFVFSGFGFMFIILPQHVPTSSISLLDDLSLRGRHITPRMWKALTLEQDEWVQRVRIHLISPDTLKLCFTYNGHCLETVAFCGQNFFLHYCYCCYFCCSK